MKPTIIFENVSKKFSKRYTSDSLRDALVKPFRGLFGRNGLSNSPEKKEFWALKDISFELKRGEAFGIIGPNGSGKSTTLKLTSRILRPDGGRIKVIGRVGALIELVAGFNPDLTGQENVYLNGSIFGMTRNDVKDRYKRIVEFAEIEDFMDTPVKWYSSGMMARLGFAMAAFLDPDILLIDEVLSVGDTWFQKKCLDKMQEYKDNGTTIVFISHNMESVASLCTRLAVLNHGKLTYIGDTADAIAHYLDLKKEDIKKTQDRVSLEKATIYDSNGNNTLTYSSGENILVDLTIKALVNVDNINIGLEVTRKDGFPISSTHYRALSGRKITLNQNGTLNLVFKVDLNFNSGIYHLTGIVHDEGNDESILRVSMGEIVIKENTNSEGIAFLNAQIEKISVSS